MKTRLVAAAVMLAACSIPAVAHPGQGTVSDGNAPPVENVVKIEVHDGFRTITSNGVPNHPIGQFPGPHNPNAVRAQHYTFRVPAEPKPAADKNAGSAKNDERRPHAEGPQLFGVAVNGVPFDPGTAEFWHDERELGWRMEAIGGPRNLGLDASNGHVQPNGAYHYHSIPLGLITMLTRERNSKQMVLVGWAADGYPMYGPYAFDKPDDANSAPRLMKPSYRLKQENRAGGQEGPGGKPDGSYTRDWEYAAGTGDLDESNGRTGVTPEFPKGTYYYVLTDAFPFVPRTFHGTPDASFTKRGPRPGERGGPGGGRGPGGGGPGGERRRGEGPREGRPDGPPPPDGQDPPPPPPEERQ